MASRDRRGPASDAAVPIVTREAELPIAVFGGGPIGLACALLLARRGMKTVVLDPRPLAEGRGDRRVLALARGSLQTLMPLLGDRRPALAPISQVHVSSAGEFGTVLIDEPAAADALGATAHYGELLAALDATAAACEAIEVRRGARAVGLEQKPDRVRVHIDDGDRLHVFDAALAVHAEGLGGAGPVDTVPAGWALVADVVLDDAARGTAFERFTREGPLALLPAPGMPDTWSLIWCSSEAAAKQRAALNDDAFIAALQRALGARRVRVLRAGSRHAFGLTESSRDRVREHRAVWLGNAAQTLHPVAGQGFNLGLRDCVTLADSLASRSGDFSVALDAYVRRRRADRAVIGAFTRWAPSLFATRAAPIAAARMLGLTALDQMPTVRRELARLLMFGVRA